MKNTDYNLFNHFYQQFQSSANKALITTESEIYSYSDIEQLSGKLANYLLELGARPGDRISAQVEKSPQSLCLYLACLRAGFVYHPLNPAYSLDELEFFINDAEPTVLVCSSENYNQLLMLAGSAGVKVETLNPDGQGTLIDNAIQCNAEVCLLPRAENDLAALLYSSGTTGVPKGIMLTHGNLLSNATTLTQTWGFTQDDRLLHCLPTFHVHGLFISLGCVLLSGATMLWLDRFDTTKVIRYLPECSVMMGVPTYYCRLLAEPLFVKQVTTSVRLFVSGSAPLNENTFYEFEQRTGQRILERYGMTETNVNTSNPLNGERKAGTVGLPLDKVDVRIVDDNGKASAIGEIGNLQVRGPNVFSGYWRLPEKTTESFSADHFFDTGDLGQVDQEGYISIVGRTKDLIISGGLNIYPKELEIVLDAHPAIKESAVIGVPHSDFGEAVVAVLVTADKNQSSADEAEIISFMKQRVANYKVPKRIFFVDELPRNTMGKVQKNSLRGQFRELFDSPAEK